MIDSARHDDLGSALEAALEQGGDSIAHIESDREREQERLTYAELARRRLAVARLLHDHGVGAGDRVAIAMTNQSKWHVAAAAVFHRGAVLVPIDWKLSGEEHLALLAHARPAALVVEHHLWRAMRAADPADPGRLAVPLVIVTGAPVAGPDADAIESAGAVAWRNIPGLGPDEADGGPTAPATAAPREAPAAGSTDLPRLPRTRDNVACLVYSSGTGGQAKGCLLTHGNYLEQFRALIALHPLRPGHRYLSILPTNHAIDFMVGFLGPYFCGATVVHLRTLRPEFVRAAFVHYGITHVALVPMILKNLATGLRARFAALSPARRQILRGLIALNRLLSRNRPDVRVARRLLPAVHDAFGGRLEAIFVGGAYTDPDTLRFFHDLGLPVANGYGLTEAGTALTLDRLDPPRPDTVGVPLPGVELCIDSPDGDGVGEILARGPMVMRGYLDAPDLTAEAFRDGWLRTGDLGRLDGEALQILGRQKNMIVTAGGKNVYPEDVETAFMGIDGAKESCVFAAHFLLPDGEARDERLILVVRLEPTGPGPAAPPVDRDAVVREVARRNRRLPDFKRVAAVLFHDADFPRTASMKVKRARLAEVIAAAPPADRPLVDVP